MATEKAKKLGAASPSFRLRNPSLNNLRLRRIFDLFDSNGDGIITPSEISLALDRLGLAGGPTDPDELSSILTPFLPSPDSPGLDFDAFQSLHRSLGDALFGSTEEPFGSSEPVKDDEEETDMAEAFKVFDEDGDGFISSRELQAVLEKLGLQEGDNMERVDAMIGSVDCNKDGRVDFKEFKNMMRSTVLVSSS